MLRVLILMGNIAGGGTVGRQGRGSNEAGGCLDRAAVRLRGSCALRVRHGADRVVIRAVLFLRFDGTCRTTGGPAMWFVCAAIAFISRPTGFSGCIARCGDDAFTKRSACSSRRRVRTRDLARVGARRPTRPARSPCSARSWQPCSWERCASNHGCSRSIVVDTSTGGLRVVIVGAGEAGAAIVRDAAHADDRSGTCGRSRRRPKRHGLSLLGVPVVGSSTELVEVVDRFDAHRVILAVAGAGQAFVSRVAEAAETAGSALQLSRIRRARS